MRLTKLSLINPAAVAIVAAVVMMLGVMSILNIPAQLLPQIENPVMSVMTSWPGASPREVESELTEKLLGGATDDEASGVQPGTPAEKPEDVLKDSLKSLFR